jgi:hypothetical protein
MASAQLSEPLKLPPGERAGLAMALWETLTPGSSSVSPRTGSSCRQSMGASIRDVGDHEDSHADRRRYVVRQRDGPDATQAGLASCVAQVIANRWADETCGRNRTARSVKVGRV